jgi:hypothetical protein
MRSINEVGTQLSGVTSIHRIPESEKPAGLCWRVFCRALVRSGGAVGYAALVSVEGSGGAETGFGRGGGLSCFLDQFR